MTKLSARKRATGWLQDHPGKVNFLLLALVLAHSVISHFWVNWIGPGHYLARAHSGDLSVFFLGVATVASMVAGFTGVVVVFALGNTSRRFRVFRSHGASRLRANWTSCTSAGFSAALLALCSSGLTLIGWHLWAWTFELSILVLLHATLRLTWLLGNLARIVAADDEAENDKESRASLKDILRGRDAS